MDPELQKALADLGVSTVKEAGAAVNKAIEEFRATADANDKKRDATFDEKLNKIEAELGKFEKVNEVVTRIEAEAKAREGVEKDHQDQLDRIEARLNRPGTDKEAVDAEAKQYEDAFFSYVRQGDMADRERLNVLQVGDDSAAGYLAGKELVLDIIKGIVEVSPMRSMVTVRTTSKTAVQWPKRTGRPAARYVGETEFRSDTDGLTYGMIDIPVVESIFEVPVSNWMLEDSDFDIEAEIRESVVEGYGEQEGRDIISGTGSKQPRGFLNAAGTVGVDSGTATTITGDALIDLKHAIKTGYARNGSYALNRLTLGAIRKLKTTEGQYLWQPGLAEGRPNTIDGELYVEAPDMPDIAAGAKPVAFGDWRRAYVLVDRLDMQMLRDPYTLRKYGQVAFSWRRRFGGDVVLPEAIAVLTIQE